MTGSVKKKNHEKTGQDIGSDCYRKPMQVTQVRIFWNKDTYYVCPRCDTSLDREYMAYCDRCGQRLDWKRRKKAVPIYIQWDGTRK